MFIMLKQKMYVKFKLTYLEINTAKQGQNK
jgi:hypothetical protein